MNILLVEDIESIIKGLTYSLEKSNYKLVIKTTIKDTKELQALDNKNITLYEIKGADHRMKKNGELEEAINKAKEYFLK